MVTSLTDFVFRELPYSGILAQTQNNFNATLNIMLQQFHGIKLLA